MHSEQIVGNALMIVTDEPPVLTEIKQKKEQPTKPTLTDEDKTNAPYIFWGDQDDFPQKMDEDFRKSGVLQTAVDVNANIHYGQGVEWAKRTSNGGKRTIEIQSIPMWDEYTSMGQFPVAQGEAVYSLEYLHIAWAEVVMTNAKRGVDNIQILDTASCRWQKRNKNGVIENVGFCSKFGKAHVANSEIEWLPLYDPKKKITDHPMKFVVPMFYRTFGNHFYPEPNMNSIRVNGWLKNALNVPKYIDAVYTNQIALKYHVTIPFALLLEFAGTTNEGWGNLSFEKRLEWKVKCKTYIDNQLTSPENAGKSIVTFSIYENGNEYAIKIEPIESKMESTKELPNAFAANYEIFAALNLDPAITGFGVPGGKNLSGSGSDKREALLIAQALRKREREVSLTLPRVLGKIMEGDSDKFPKGLFPVYIDTDTSQTLDENPTGKQTVVK
jgi:hypothetical protein